MTAERARTPDRYARGVAALRGFSQSYVREGRGGEPLVLVHGESATARVWRHDVGPLAEAGFDVVAPDLRGFGESGPAPGAEVDVATHSADLHSLLRGALGFQRVTVVGGQLGAAVACDFALRFPGFAQRLVLLGAPPGDRDGAMPVEALLLYGDSERRERERWEVASRRFLRRIGPFGIARGPGVSPQRGAEVLDGVIRHLCRADRGRRGETTAFVALGSNLGDRERRLAAGFAALRALPGVRDVAASRVYETDPVGPGDQGPYLNAAARLRTRLSPRALLEALLAIERAEGRERTGERNAPRTLDLDLLLHGRARIREPDLVVPHPRLAERPFVLEPLCDLAPDLDLPGLGRSVAALAAAVRDPSAVRVRED